MPKIAIAHLLLFLAVLQAVPTVISAQTSPVPFPGWYANSPEGAQIETSSDANASLMIMWRDSYVYPHQSEDNLYWYAQVAYVNTGNETLTVNCNGRTYPSFTREFIINTDGVTGSSVYFPAIETFCSHYPKFQGSIEPGNTHFEWAIFDKMPRKEVSLGWNPYHSSPWVNPWTFTDPANTPPPAVCPSALVSLGTCYPAETVLNNVVEQSLNINECYHGIHQYFNQDLVGTLLDKAFNLLVKKASEPNGLCDQYYKREVPISISIPLLPGVSIDVEKLCKLIQHPRCPYD